VDTRADVPRKAASAIVAHDGDRGLEVLVLERGRTTRFLPGYVAFPGGSTDEADAGLAERWFGSREEAARACAVREMAEEVGLVLTADGLAEADGRSFEEMTASPPAVAQLPEIARWIAPERVPVRFDARYFAVRAPRGLDAVPDGVEATAVWWATPHDLLEAWRTSERLLFWPTYFTLQAIVACSSVDELLSLRIPTREPDDGELERLPRATFWQAEP
jgi:8-oxo-dGTP pyrophosphatase MutT (NUDIX family)